MSYKEYAMGMSFRLNPKNIRKDTFLVPFEGLSREQEMYDTYVSPLAASDEELVAGYNEGGIVEREGFKDGPKIPFTDKLQIAVDEINKRNELGILSRAEDIAKVSGIDKSDINKYIRENRLPALLNKEDAVVRYLNKSLQNNSPLINFKNKSISDYVNHELPAGSKGRVGTKEIEKFIKINKPELWEKLYSKKTGAMDFINRNPKIQSLGVQTYLEDPALIRNQQYIENLSLGSKRDELRILNAKLKLGAKDFAISQAQDRLVDDLNRAIRKDPDLVLKNPKLMELATTKFDTKIGAIVKNARSIADVERDIKAGFFSKEHLNPKSTGKINVEFPTNKILVPRQTNESFIRSSQSYLKNNPGDLQALDEVEKFTNDFGFNVKLESGKLIGPKIGSTVTENKLDSFSRQLNNYNIDSTQFDLSVPEISKSELLIQKQPLAQRATSLTDIIAQQLTEKEKNTIELVKKFNSSPGMMKMYDKELLLSIGDDFKKIGTKLAPFVKGGARVVGGILLGTTRPEIAATLAIDAMFPVSELVQGASLKEAAGASFFNQMLNLFGGGIDNAKTQVDELIASGKEIGLNDQEIQRLKIIKNQFDNQVKLQDAGYELETYKIAEKERGPENIDAFFQSEYQNAEKNFNDALKNFQDYDQEQALTDYDILKRALNRKIGIRAERIPTGPQETIQDTGGLPPQLETPFLSKFEKAAMKEAGTFIPKAGTEEELSDVFLKETTGKTLQELQQQQEQATQEQKAMTELDEGLLMMNNVFEQGKQGFKKGGMVQRQGFADGPKMPRRGFLGLLAGLGTYIASLPFFKPTTKIGKEVLKQAPKVKGTPEWFPLLTDEIVKKGKDITAKAAIEDGQIVKMIEVDGDEVTGVFNRDGSIEVNVQSGDGAFEQPYTLRYDPPRADYDPNSGLIKQPGNFTVLEESPYSVVTGDPKNPDFDYEFDVDEADFGFHLSDTTRLEKHVTGKPERLIRNKTGQMPGSNNPDPVDVLVNKYGDYDDTIPDDYYD